MKIFRRAGILVVVTAQEVIKHFSLKPLPVEGGFFAQSYVDPDRVDVSSFPGLNGDRPCSTGIYYLVTPESFSKLHRLCSLEVFHFYAGDSVEMLQIDQDCGRVEVFTLGQDILGAELPQLAVPAGVWQGSKLKKGGQWALLGCTVAPGYDQSDFSMANPKELVEEFPEHQKLIESFS